MKFHKLEIKKISLGTHKVSLITEKRNRRPNHDVLRTEQKGWEITMVIIPVAKKRDELKKGSQACNRKTYSSKMKSKKNPQIPRRLEIPFNKPEIEG